MRVKISRGKLSNCKSILFNTIFSLSVNADLLIQPLMNRDWRNVWVTFEVLICVWICSGGDSQSIGYWQSFPYFHNYICFFENYPITIHDRWMRSCGFSILYAFLTSKLSAGDDWYCSNFWKGKRCSLVLYPVFYNISGIGNNRALSVMLQLGCS